MKFYSLIKSSVLIGQRSARVLCRRISSQVTKQQRQKVLVSSSTNIYENLALEDWLFENTDLNNETVLLLWRDAPCVVFGRHQNPWLECNIPYCEKYGIDVARRKSGGGTVYHDEGNLNCSFMMKKSLYNRQKNLQLVVDALKSKWDLPLSINDRDDILLFDKYKISGTAAKLSRDKTYHHFTLLYDVDTIKLKSILYSNMVGAVSKSTVSTRMPVMNLVDLAPNVDFQSLVHVISERFAENPESSAIEYVNPCDNSMFPGIDKHLTELKSWEWKFAKTPPFSIHREFQEEFSKAVSHLQVNLEVTKGKLHNLDLKLVQPKEINPNVLMSLQVGMEGTKFSQTDINKNLSLVKMEWIAQKLYNIETHSVLDWILLCVLETVALHHGRTPTQRTNGGDVPYRLGDKNQASW